MYPNIDTSDHFDKLAALKEVIRSLVPELGEEVAETYASAWFLNMHSESGYIKAYWSVHVVHNDHRAGEVHILQELDRDTEEHIRASALLLFT